MNTIQNKIYNKIIDMNNTSINLNNIIGIDDDIFKLAPDQLITYFFYLNLISRKYHVISKYNWVGSLMEYPNVFGYEFKISWVLVESDFV